MTMIKGMMTRDTKRKGKSREIERDKARQRYILNLFPLSRTRLGKRRCLMTMIKGMTKRKKEKENRDRETEGHLDRDTETQRERER